MSSYPDRGPETLKKYFAGAKFIFLSVVEKICGSPLPEHEIFSKFLRRLCERRLPNYRSVIVPSRKQGSFHATQKLKRHYEAIILSLPQIVFYRLVEKIWWRTVRTYPRCAIYWHTFPRDQQQPWFFLETRERTQGTRLLASSTQRKKCRVCKTLQHGTFWHFNIFHFGTRNGKGAG